MQFINAQVGWLLGDRKLWRSNDGGITWQLLTTPPSQEGDSEVPRFFGARSSRWAWIQWGRDIFRTIDGGAVWTRQGQLPDTNPGAWGFNSVSFVNGSIGWATGCSLSDRRRGPPFDDHPTIYRTVNGGKTWSQQALPGLPKCQDSLVQGLSVDRAFIATPNAIYRTSNGGVNWTSSRVDLESVNEERRLGRPSNFFFLDRQNGWIGFEEGTLLRTDDAGVTWKLQKRVGEIWKGPRGSGEFGEVFFASQYLGWILGGDGSIHETLDGGINWHRIPAQEFLHILTCAHPGKADLTCWAVGETRLWRLQ